MGRVAKHAFELPSLPSLAGAATAGLPGGLGQMKSLYDGYKQLTSPLPKVKPVSGLNGTGGSSTPTPKYNIGGLGMAQQHFQGLGQFMQAAGGQHWNPQVAQAWQGLTGQYKPPPPPVASQQGPGLVSTATKQLGRFQPTIQGAFGAVMGAPKWLAGRAGEAAFGQGGWWSDIKIQGRQTTLQGAGQVAGNVVGGASNLARYGHSWAPTIAKYIGSPEYAKEVERGYQQWWGKEPGKGWADQAEHYATGGTADAKLNPLSESMRETSRQLRHYSDSATATTGDHVMANLYDTFAHPDVGLFGLATGGLASGGGLVGRGLGAASSYFGGQ